MHFHRRFYFTLLFLFSAVYSPAQNGSPVFINFTTRNGLASNETYRILQDKEGYIWIATDFGLSRYDGYSFKNYGVADGLPENSILELFMDQKGKIWFNTFGSSIGYIEHEKIFTIPMNAKLRKQIASPLPNSFYTTDGDTLYYSVNNNSGYFKITETTIQHVVPSFDKPGMKYIFERKDPEHVFSYKIFDQVVNDELLLYFNNSEPYIIKGNSLPLRTHAHSGISYITVINTLFKVNGKNEVEMQETGGQVLFTKSLNGKFFMAKIKSGLEVYDKDPFSGTAAKYLDGLSVSDVALDREGGLWVSTLDHGIYYLPNKNIFEVAFNTTHFEKTVTSMVSTKDKVYFGTLNGHIYEWDAKSCTSLPVESVTRNKRVLALAYDDASNSLVAGSYQNSFVMRDKKITGSQYNGAEMFLRKDEDGKIWGGNSDYLYYFDKEKIRQEKLTFSRSLRVFDILPLEKNKMLAATIEGLYHIYPDDTLYKVHENDTLNTIRFTCLEKINSKIIVAGTRGQGIVVLIGDEFFFINTHNKIPDNCIQDIIVEGSVVYAATNNGIAKINFDLSDPHKYHITNYSTSEGYMLNKVTSIARLGDNIYAGTEDGLFYFNPEKNNSIDIPPAILLSGIIINNKPAVIDSAYELNYNENNISIRFTGISPRSLGHITYLYKMRPEDSWLTTNLREINFSALTPGKYTFECVAQNAAGISSAVPLRLNFHILRPMWKTWWFKSLMVLISIFAAYYIFLQRFQRRYLLQQHELARVKTIEEERHRIAADMHDDLGTDLTNLVLSTHRMAQRKEATSDELEKVSGNASDLIDKLSQIIWAMNPAYDYLPNLTAYVTRFVAKQCELNSVQFILDKPEEIPHTRVGASLRRNIFLILKEALNNAFRHGKPNEVTLKLSFYKNFLVISLRDNGQGFSPDEKMNSGNGISNLHKRAKLIDADLSILSSAGNGTEIIIAVKTGSAAQGSASV